MGQGERELVSNRRARHSYEILDTYESGIVLLGTEIKSLRSHGASLQEAYVKVEGCEAWLLSCHIPPYRYGSIHNHEELRPRKLLLHKRELLRLKGAVQEKGLTIVPLSLYLVKGRVKVRIAIARGKKGSDKRQAIKEREELRRIDKAMKEHR